MFNPYRAFRQFERKLFQGVPERPETSWGRDSNALVPERLTGRSQFAPDANEESPGKGRIIATIKYRPDSDEATFHRPDGQTEVVEDTGTGELKRRT
jgi:hypothetical protein